MPSRSPTVAFVGHGVGGFVDGDRLAGERRLFRPQVLDVDEAKVRRDLVARFEQHDVARHQLLGRDHARFAIAQGPRLGGQHVADRIQRLLRLALLNEAEQPIDDDDAENDRGVEPQAEHQLDEPGGQ